jgi:hypothetical protein
VNVSSYLEAHRAFFEAIAGEGRENPSARRRKICQNYVEHAALEYVGRWDEVLQPERTIEEPIYKIQLGSPEPVVYEGHAAVAGFYSQVTPSEGIFVMPNSDTHFAVADWGFATFLTTNLFQTGAELQEQGFEADEPNGNYVLQTGLAYYWLYDERARLIGEVVHEVAPTTVIWVPPEEVVTKDDMRNVVKPYLPHARQVGSCDAFQ